MSYPNGYVYKYNSSIFTQNYQQLLKYNKKIGKHNVSILAGHESYKSNTDYLYADRKNTSSMSARPALLPLKLAEESTM